MDWSSVGKTIANAAPVLGTIIGGPAGTAVGALVASALGTSNDPDAISTAISIDPTGSLAKLKELEINSKVQLQQIDAQARLNELQAEGAQYAAEAADRDSARKLAATQPRDVIRPAITIVLLLGSIGIMTAILGGWATETLKDNNSNMMVGIIVGYWFSEMKSTLGFYFGMTKESQKQTTAITEFATAPGTVSVDNKVSSK